MRGEIFNQSLMWVCVVLVSLLLLIQPHLVSCTCHLCERHVVTPKMRFAATLIAAITLAGNVLARNPRSRKYVRRGWSPDPEPQVAKRFPAPRPSGGPPTYSSTVIPETNKTAKFKVDGTSLPDVDFDIGESYAGLLPISDEPNAAELYWWFFPSHNPQAGDEILIW